MKRRRIEARVGETTTAYKLAQVWSDLNTRNTYYLATEDGKPCDLTDIPCVNLDHYQHEVLNALLIVKREEHAESYVVKCCKVDRKPQFALTPARVPMRSIEGLD